jgi:hypothetical protein
MRKFLLTLTAVLGAAALAVPAAFADSPHFVTGPTTSTSVSGNTISLYVSFKAAGLGNATAYANWDVSGTGMLSSRCYNNGNNAPQAANKQESVPFDTPFTTAVNHGQTTVTNQLVTTVTSTLSCPKGQHVVVESFSASGTLTLIGNSLTANLTWSYPS